jgi:hypothetical protein
MYDYPIGSVVIHKKKPEFGYGIVVTNFSDLEIADQPDESIVVVLWHGDEEKELIEMPQFHACSELKILNTQVGFA